MHERHRVAPVGDRVLDRRADQPLGALARDRLDADARASRGSGSSSRPSRSGGSRSPCGRLPDSASPLDAGVDVLGVLAEDHHVGLARVLDRARHAREVAHRPQADVEIELLAQRDVERADAAADRRRQRALDRDRVLARRPRASRPAARRRCRRRASPSRRRRSPSSRSSACRRRPSRRRRRRPSSITGVMSTPMPSPSMKGMIGLSGVGWPGTILAPPAGISMCVVVLIGLPCARGDRRRPRLSQAAPEGAARQIATVLIEGFDRHYRLFRATSARAKELFEAGAWLEQQQAVQERIRFYDERVRECVERLRGEFDVEALSDETWRDAKLYYIGLLVEHSQPELAETFFNSVIKRILRSTYFDNDFIFVRPAISTEYIESDPPIYRSYYPNAERRARVLRTALPRLRLEPALRRPRPRRRPRAARARRAARRAVDAPRAELPDPGAELGLLPQQGRLRDRQVRQRPRRAAVRRRRSCTTPTAGSSSTRSCSSRSRSTSSSRSRAPTSWSTWRCRRATSSSCAR